MFVECIEQNRPITIGRELCPTPILPVIILKNIAQLGDPRNTT